MMGPPSVPPSDVAMQLRHLVVRGNVGVLVEEERSGVEPVGAAMDSRPSHGYVLVPEAVLMSMCAPEVEPCCASYIEAFTRTSESVSGAGVGMALPMER